MAAGALITPAAAMTPSAESDSIAHPPAREQFVTADGLHRLVVASVDGSGWKSRRSSAEMQRRDGSAWRTQWRLDLPHAYRPRFALATPQGGAVLLDEWINIRSALAIMVVGTDGRQVSVTHLDTVLQLLAVPVDQVVRMASSGWWLQSPPHLSADGKHAEVRSAGKLLRIRLSDGSLSLG